MKKNKVYKIIQTRKMEDLEEYMNEAARDGFVLTYSSDRPINSYYDDDLEEDLFYVVMSKEEVAEKKE